MGFGGRLWKGVIGSRLLLADLAKNVGVVGQDRERREKEGKYIFIFIFFNCKNRYFYIKETNNEIKTKIDIE